MNAGNRPRPTEQPAGQPNNPIQLHTEAVNNRLQVLINKCREKSLREPMAYSIFAGGKRLRPLLLLAACEAACGGYDESVLDFACSVEMIHTYSLIHDDLPAMDDDDYRRGRLTCHKAYGEATAILTGDALLSYAFECMLAVCVKSRAAQRYVKAMQIIARAVGANGMVAGQAMDMYWGHKTADECTLLTIHERKTTLLITACLSAGAVLGLGTAAYVKKMTRLGYLTGLAFQIRDDILDVESSSELLGKSVNSDAKNQKNTYVSVFGMDKAREDYRKLSHEALTLTAEIPHKTDTLYLLIEWIINRTN